MSSSKELGVRFILQGSVRRNQKNAFRINIQLMDGVTDENVWADRYDASTEDLLKVGRDYKENYFRTLHSTHPE